MRKYSSGSRPWDEARAVLKKYIFRPFGPQFGLEIRGVGLPGLLPWIRHLPDVFNWTENLIIDSHLFITFLSFFNLLRSYCHLENFWRCIIAIFHHPDFIYMLRIDWRLPWKSSRQELTLYLSWESFWQQDFPFFFVRDKKPEGWWNSNKCTIITYPTQSNIRGASHVWFANLVRAVKPRCPFSAW